jgi:hypothetical protein
VAGTTLQTVIRLHGQDESSSEVYLSEETEATPTLFDLSNEIGAAGSGPLLANFDSVKHVCVLCAQRPDPIGLIVIRLGTPDEALTNGKRRRVAPVSGKHQGSRE